MDVSTNAIGVPAAERAAALHAAGFGYGTELLDEMTAMKVVHWSPPGP